MIVRPRVRGLVRLLVLHVLREGPMHGYKIMRRIGEMFGGMYEPSPGVIYPTLQYLEDRGLVESERVDRKTVYRLTEGGERYLREREGELEGSLKRARAMRGLTGIIPRGFFGLFTTLMSKCGELTDEQREEIRASFERLMRDVRKVLGE